jgi:hypothetical protein
MSDAATTPGPYRPRLVRAPVTLALAPSVTDLDAMDPLAAAKVLSQFARECGTLPPHLAARRALYVDQSREIHKSAALVAAEIHMHISGVYRLIKQAAALKAVAS